MTRVGAAAVGQITDHIGQLVSDLGEVDGAHPSLGGAGQALGHPVDSDDVVAQVMGNPGRHIADGAEAEYGHRPAVRDVGVGDGLPGGRQDVGQVDVARVGRSRGDLDVRELGLGHP